VVSVELEAAEVEQEQLVVQRLVELEEMELQVQ
jgi:hypothetical protein